MSASQTKVQWDDVRALSDIVLPGDDHFPAAGDIEGFDVFIERAFRAQPELAVVVLEMSNRAAVENLGTVEQLAASHPQDVETVLFVLHAAYFMVPAVRDLLGYPGQGRRPIALATPGEVVSDDLIAPVIDRGPTYVVPPT